MTATIQLSARNPKDQLFHHWTPYARFQIPSELKGQKYRELLHDLWVRFIGTLSDHPTNQYSAMRFRFANMGEQGGTASFYIGGDHFRGCKMHYYDDSDSQNFFGWHGIVIRDHTELRSMVEPVYTIAEKFEQFLTAEGVPYQRLGRAVEATEEVQQVTEV